jgi:hypothetical protein
MVGDLHGDGYIYIYIVGKKMGWIEVVDEFNLLFICGVWI